MVRSHTVKVWSHYLPRKVYWVVVVVVSGGGRPNLVLAQVQAFSP